MLSSGNLWSKSIFKTSGLLGCKSVNVMWVSGVLDERLWYSYLPSFAPKSITFFEIDTLFSNSRFWKALNKDLLAELWEIINLQPC